jgi:DNA-binding transcriptional ArsR family regulator
VSSFFEVFLEDSLSLWFVYGVLLRNPYSVLVDALYLLTADGAVASAIGAGSCCNDFLIFAFDVSGTEGRSHACQSIRGRADFEPPINEDFLLTNHNHWVMVLDMQSATDNLFKALADPTRRAIFERLTRDGEQTVHALTERAGVSQPMVSKHLSALKRARLVRHRRQGRETHYEARPEALAPFVDWIGHYGAFWRSKFDQLGDVLERMDK